MPWVPQGDFFLETDRLSEKRPERSAKILSKWMGVSFSYAAVESTLKTQNLSALLGGEMVLNHRIVLYHFVQLSNFSRPKYGG